MDIQINKLKRNLWQAIKQRCAGQVGTMLELLQGKLSDQVMAIVTDRTDGLFPQPGEIKLGCSCPDWAVMCKHVAAVLYGVGSRLDEQPELLFTLRGVDPQELIALDLALPANGDSAAQTLADDQLSEVFGIDLDETPPVPPDSPSSPAPKKRKKAARQTRKPGVKKATKRMRKKRPVARLKTASRQPATRSKRTATMRLTGKSVARLRRQLKLSAAAFADQLGVTPATIYRWESTAGRLQLQSRSLQALADLHKKANDH